MDISDYFGKLSEEDKKMYMDKISIIGSLDPYTLKNQECSTKIDDFPNILYPDIFMYLVTTKSKYTLEEMRSYKSLEAYNQAACGWVRNIMIKKLGHNSLIISKVMHSQRLREKNLSPWILAENDGKIETAHCDCVAGFSGVCSHVAATLFEIEKVIRRTEQCTSTGRKAYWMPPSNKPAEPKSIREIDFATPKMKFCERSSTQEIGAKRRKESIPAMTAEERINFLGDLMESDDIVVSHFVTPPFAGRLKEISASKNKLYIMDLFDDKYLNESLEELQNIGRSIDIGLTVDESKSIEEETREQSNVKSWFRYRAGRVTASTFKSCCRTKLEKPSLSLIKSICYPSTHRSKVKALNYGCNHEKHAANQFADIMKERHVNFSFKKFGFLINPCSPYFGASPDGLMSCDCCSDSLVEIKCPHCARFSGVEEKIASKEFYLKAANGQISLQTNHAYYYQIQMQLALSELERCYLVVWSPKDLVYIEVKPNEQFWEEESVKAKEFFYKILLPEALGKYFTRGKPEDESIETVETEEIFWDPHLPWVTSTSSSSLDFPQPSTSFSTVDYQQPSTSKILYCICRKEDDKKTPMIACDSGNCSIEWYHLKCVGLTSIPEEPWKCTLCS